MPASLTIAATRNIPPSVFAVVVDPKPLRLPRDHSPVFRRGDWSRHTAASLNLPLALDPVLRGDEESLFVPLSALARLPLCGAEVAELVPAPTCHVVAAERELDEVAAPRTALPALLARERDDSLVLRAGTTNERGVCRSLAMATRLCSAFGAREAGGRRSCRSKEGGAGGAVTVYSVLGSELHRLFVH